MTARVLVSARILWGMSAAVVAVLSLLPPDDLPSDLGLSDKLLHVLGYAVLGALGVLSGARWPWALLAVVGYGLALEGAQGLLGYRSFEWADLVADAAGAVVGVLVASRVMREVQQSRDARRQSQKRQERRERRERARNPNKDRAMNPVKAGAKRGAPTWQQVAKRQGSKCWLCGTRTYADDHRRDASGTDRLGKCFPCVDYVVALESGGTYAESNLRLAHRHCASARRANPALTTFGRPPRTYT